MNISIISSCNNDCEYCFQKDYHKENKMLSYEEIDDIIQWGLSESRIGILGGEPTLHPDIVKIIKRVKEFNSICVFTNLLCKQELLKELIEVCGVDYLVNTTSRDELKDLFYSNIEFLYSKKDYLQRAQIGISLGLTLMNNEEIDSKYIDNLFNIIDTFPGLTSSIRMGIATPFHEGTFDLMNYSKPVKYMIEKVLRDYQDITIGFDCPSNNCQISPILMGECLENPRIKNFTLGCSTPVLDVLVDKSLKYCFSFPDDFLRVNDYRRFANAEEARRWYVMRVTEYMVQNAYQCRYNKISCENKVCKGSCPAVNEYLRRQNQVFS